MIIPGGEKFHRKTVWESHALGTKIQRSHFRCKTANKCLNVCEQVTVEEVPYMRCVARFRTICTI